MLKRINIFLKKCLKAKNLPRWTKAYKTRLQRMMCASALNTTSVERLMVDFWLVCPPPLWDGGTARTAIQVHVVNRTELD